MLGRSALLVCTEAVERTVHRHLEDQIRWLSADHPQIADRLINIQVEEMEHLQFAVARTPRPKPRSVQVLDLLITGATEALIWLSTYGASLSVARQIKAKALRRTP
jgi:ubiquinone biosynthesis monooxygenase Coq7